MYPLYDQLHVESEASNTSDSKQPEGNPGSLPPKYFLSKMLFREFSSGLAHSFSKPPGDCRESAPLLLFFSFFLRLMDPSTVASEQEPPANLLLKSGSTNYSSLVTTLLLSPNLSSASVMFGLPSSTTPLRRATRVEFTSPLLDDRPRESVSASQSSPRPFV